MESCKSLSFALFYPPKVRKTLSCVGSTYRASSVRCRKFILNFCATQLNHPPTDAFGEISAVKVHICVYTQLAKNRSQTTNETFMRNFNDALKLYKYY